MKKSLQDKYAPKSICFGCGPANKEGLQIKSFPSEDEVHCEWNPQKHHEAYPGLLNGGIIGSILDCHCNWTAAYFIMKRLGLKDPLCTVTAKYTIKLLRPTPSETKMKLIAKVSEISDDRAVIEGELYVKGKLCATCTGTFVAVKEGHPAYHRWN